MPIPLCLPHSHVQVSNDDAKEFYQKFGFHIVDTKEQYYKRIDPPHAFVLQKDLKGPFGLISWSLFFCNNITWEQ